MVLAIGNPFGVGQTITSGIVSALARTRVGISDYQFFIQTDAAINPGNSGGALVDMQGRLVGINTAIFSKSGGSQGIGFAIPANMVRLVVDSALQGGSVRLPWLGASLVEVSAEYAAAAGLDRAAGALVSYLVEDGPAAAAGLKAGDIIVSVDGKEISDPNAFQYRFTTRGISGEASLEVLRSGTRRKLSVALMVAPRTRLAIRGISPATTLLPAPRSQTFRPPLPMSFPLPKPRASWSWKRTYVPSLAASSSPAISSWR